MYLTFDDSLIFVSKGGTQKIQILGLVIYNLPVGYNEKIHISIQIKGVSISKMKIRPVCKSQNRKISKLPNQK